MWASLKNGSYQSPRSQQPNPSAQPPAPERPSGHRIAPRRRVYLLPIAGRGVEWLDDYYGQLGQR